MVPHHESVPDPLGPDSGEKGVHPGCSDFIEGMYVKTSGLTLWLAFDISLLKALG